MKYEEIIKELKSKASAKNRAGMARFGIQTDNAFGVSMPEVRKIGKVIGNPPAGGQKLSLELWQSGIHEAKILASIVGEPKLVLEKQMDNWVNDFDSWDVCDQVCMNLFDKTNFAFKKAKEWPKSEREFTRRAGFALMAALAVHDKTASDQDFIKLFPLIKTYSTDERNFVRKAVNWALRQIGKRNQNLNQLTLKLSEEILKIDSKTSHWIAADAIRKLKLKKF
jgi:3-methyladenine DNA glycosylase AlkD